MSAAPKVHVYTLKLNSVTGNIQSHAAHLSDLSILPRDFGKKQAWNSLTNGTGIFHEIGKKLYEYGVQCPLYTLSTLNLLWAGVSLVRWNWHAKRPTEKHEAVRSVYLVFILGSIYSWPQHLQEQEAWELFLETWVWCFPVPPKASKTC